MIWRRDSFTITDDPAKLDLVLVHKFLAHESYWAKGVAFEEVVRASQKSLTFGMYEEQDQQIGYGRVITDGTTVAYCVDIFILPPYRRRGLGTWLFETICAHPDLQTIRRWLLATKDAHNVYKTQGFSPLKEPEIYMEKTSLKIAGAKSD